MIQLCMVGGSQPPDRPLSDVYAEMQAKNLNVMDVLVLITGNATCSSYLAQYAPLVTGAEDLYSAATLELDKQLLGLLMRRTGGNQSEAARILGITRASLRKRLKAAGIQVKKLSVQGSY